MERSTAVGKQGRRARRPIEFLFPDLQTAAHFVKCAKVSRSGLQIERRARRVQIRGLQQKDLSIFQHTAQITGGDIVLATETGRRAQKQCEGVIDRLVHIQIGRSSRGTPIWITGKIVRASVANITKEGRPLFWIEIKYGPSGTVHKGVFGRVPKAWSGDYEAPRKRRTKMAKKKTAKKEKVKGKGKKGLPEGDVKSLLKKLETETNTDEKKLLRRALRVLGHKGGLRKPKTGPKPKDKGKSKKKGKKGKRAKKS